MKTQGHDGLVEAAARRVGAILNNKWRLDALLGVGGTAAVYAATHRNGNRVAIKVLHAHFSLDEGFRARLQQEGYVANLIEHPGAVRILDDDRSEDGAVFLVMELLAGEGLDARLKRKGWRLPEPEALGITFCLLDVLSAAHAKGVVHRDIKPDNVFVTRDGQIKVLDFGIAHVLDVPEATGNHGGALFGTLGFMAPEQALGHTAEIDARTDVWAVGATLFTVLSGRLVHEAPSAEEQLVQAATRTAPPLAAVMPDIDAHVAALVDRALAFNPAQRWQSAAEMQAAVRDIVLAKSAPDTAPVLQGPRVSVEVDIDAVGIARGRWASTSFSPLSPLQPSLQPSIVGTPAAPTMIMPKRPGGRVSRVALAAAAGTVLVAGLLIRQAGTFRAAAPTAPAATPSAVLAPPTPEAVPVAPPTSLATTLSTIEITPTPSTAPADVAVEREAPRASARTSAALADDDRPRRRFLRRVTTPSTPAPATRSITDDDALWGKRH